MLNSVYRLAALRSKRADEIQAEYPSMSRIDAVKIAIREIKD